MTETLEGPSYRATVERMWDLGGTKPPERGGEGDTCGVRLERGGGRCDRRSVQRRGGGEGARGPGARKHGIVGDMLCEGGGVTGGNGD